MIWKGEELVTIRDFLTKGINQCKSPAESEEFMRVYRAENPRADENMEFMSCYYAPDDILRIQTWFGIHKGLSAQPLYGIK